MEFVFEQVDTSRVTGKTYLPMFINEAVSKFMEIILLIKKRKI